MKTAVQPIEKPMLFSSAMVRALLDGSKTQTRRVVKSQPVTCRVSGCDGNHWIWKGHHTEWDAYVKHGGLFYHHCPHPVGSEIWVKETFQEIGKDQFVYRSDCKPNEDACIVWKPSIFMPRKFSRITLEVTAVKVERVQDISEEDAKAEGCDTANSGSYPTGAIFLPNDRWATRNYCKLWESINGKKNPWSSNPWVWCYTFRVIQPTKAT